MSYKYISTLVITLLMGLALTGCDSAGTGEDVALGRADISCTHSKCTSLVAGVVDAVVNITLSGCAEDQIQFEEYATGSVSLSCTGSGCAGYITNWSPSEIPSRSYYVCGWIDINNDGVRNAQDVFYDERTYIMGSPLSIRSWGESHFWSRQRR